MSENTNAAKAAANDRAGVLLQFARIMKRFPVYDQSNVVSAVRSIYCCRVQKYSLSGYEKCIKKMTMDELAAVIKYVMILWP